MAAVCMEMTALGLTMLIVNPEGHLGYNSQLYLMFMNPCIVIQIS